MSLLLSKSTFKLRISHKLPLFIVGAALVTALAIGIANYMSAAKEVEAAANEKLSALMESRRQALTDYLGSIEQDMRYTATNPYVYEALAAYQAAWAELGGIEALLCERLVEALRRELRAEPWGTFGQASALLRGISTGLSPERSLLDRLCRKASANPVELWRAGAPQLEATLWPFFSARTRYLANTTALALNQPSPFPPLIWHPGRREFSD